VRANHRRAEREKREQEHQAQRVAAYDQAESQREAERRASIEAEEATYAQAIAEAETGLTHELATVRMLSADTLRVLRSMTPMEYAFRH